MRRKLHDPASLLSRGVRYYDYERLPQSSEAMMYFSMTPLMLRRLTAT